MFHDVSVTVIGGLILSLALGLAAALIRWFRRMRKMLLFIAKQRTNDGNGSWRSNIDKRLTAIERATPGVTPKPEKEESNDF